MPDLLEHRFLLESLLSVLYNVCSLLLLNDFQFIPLAQQDEVDN